MTGGCTCSPGGGTGSADARSRPAIRDLPLDVVGCIAISTSAGKPTCELGEARTVQIVLPAGVKGAEVRAEDGGTGKRPDGPVVDAGRSSRDDTSSLALTVPPDVTLLRVDAELEGTPARGSFAVVAGTHWAWLEDARAARAKGELDRAAALATAHDVASSPVERALAKGLLARIALARGHADDAFPLFREAIGLHRAAGRVSDAADDSFALAFALHQRSRRYTEARSVLDAAAADITFYPEGRARAPYYRGTLAAETGDRRTALALLREAERSAHRLGMQRLERNARSALALELQELGRAKVSLPVLAALEGELDRAAEGTVGERPSACERAEVANNRGWGALLVNEALVAEGLPPSEDARGPLERALAIEGCADLYVRGFAHANLARLALAEGDLATTARRLGEARATVKEPRGTERIGWLELEARLLLARHKSNEALHTIDDALALARASVLHLQEWSLLVSRGDALVALGQTDEAVETLRAAEDVLDDATLLVPLGEGRGAFTGGRSRSARALFGLLVKRGDLRGAATVAERAQARVLAGATRALRLAELPPSERARWEAAVVSFRMARSEIDLEAARREHEQAPHVWARPAAEPGTSGLLGSPSR